MIDVTRRNFIITAGGALASLPGAANHPTHITCKRTRAGQTRRRRRHSAIHPSIRAKSGMTQREREFRPTADRSLS